MCRQAQGHYLHHSFEYELFQAKDYLFEEPDVLGAMRREPVSLSIAFRVVDARGRPIPEAELDESTDRLIEILGTVRTDTFQDFDVDTALGFGEVNFTAEVLAPTLDASVLVPGLMTLVWKAIEQVGGVVDLGQEIHEQPRGLGKPLRVIRAPEPSKPVWRPSADHLLPV